MVNGKRIKDICTAFIDEKLNIKYRMLGRVNIVDEEMMLNLKESGCTAIGYGIESGSQEVLNGMNKNITLEQIRHAVHITKQAGIVVTTPVMFGQPGENKETLRKTKELLMEITDCHERRGIRPLTPYPGTPIFRWAVEKGYIANEEDFFRKFKHAETMSFNFTDMSNEEFYQELKKANKELQDYYKEKLDYTSESCDLSFTGKSIKFINGLAKLLHR